MAEQPAEQIVNTSIDMPKLTRGQRYHLLNREKRLAKAHEKYINDPEVIRRKEEREKLKAEKRAKKEAEKEARTIARRQQKQIELQDKIKLAAETKRIRTMKPKIAEISSDPLEHHDLDIPR